LNILVFRLAVYAQFNGLPREECKGLDRTQPKLNLV
jgi:hypothetical protein